MLRTTFEIQKGRLIYKYPVTLDIAEDRIYFESSPYEFKDEIKTFAGYRWHGRDTPPRKIWSIDNCPRNVFQIKALMGEDVYAWFDRPLELIPGPIFREGVEGGKEVVVEVGEHQIDAISRILQYRYQVIAAEMGLGKCLISIEAIERSGKKNWWYAGPTSALESFEREMKKWNLDTSIRIRCMTYEALTKLIRYEFDGLVPPDGIILDEISLCKTPGSNRTIAAQAIADLIREKHGFEGYVIGLSGTPNSKCPADLWSILEIVYPGYLVEGSRQAFERRYGLTKEVYLPEGTTITTLAGWNEDEVALLPERYDGLMTVYRKMDWLDLPEKKYITEICEPSPRTLRVARMLANVAPSTIVGLSWLRALSSGFQYEIKAEGEKECPVCSGEGVYFNPEECVCPGCEGKKMVPDYVRSTTQVDCPKDGVVRKWLDICEPHGRIVLSSAFQGGVDRLLGLCKERGWAVACIDGRGWRSYDCMGNVMRGVDPLDLWEQYEGKVALCGNPDSMAYGITLTKAHVLLVYDNTFKSEKRLQLEDRIHRISMNRSLGATIVDIVHLPVDQRVIDVLRDNKKLELLSLGVVRESIGIGDDNETLLQV